MKKMNLLLSTLFVALCALSYGQDSTTVESKPAKLLSSIPKEVEEYKATEKNFIASVNWLESVPANTEKEKHAMQYAYIVAWLSGSPTVTLTLNMEVLPFTKKNDELLIVYMAGYGKYSVENDYSDNQVKCSLAGIRSAIAVYELGGLKKDKKMQQLVDLDKSGELEAWVKEKLS